jgi:hypothetical protein
MGGRGSGKRAGFGLLVDKTTDFRAIDLARNSGLALGARGRFSWWRGDNDGSISFAVERSGLRLNYRSRWRSCEWQDINETSHSLRPPPISAVGAVGSNA